MSGLTYGELRLSPYYEDGGYNEDSVSFSEAYPLITYGKQGDWCQYDKDCLSGLQCLGNPNNSLQTCQLPPELDASCSRTYSDQRCHRILHNGQKVYCQETMCPPIPAKTPPPVPEAKCSAAESYYHEPSHSRFCIFVNQQNGNVEQVPPKCCDKTMMWNHDLEEEYVKYALSAQYDGLYS